MSKADKTKEYIIERTARIFNTKGYAGTSLNDLTEATGLTKGSIYGNFKNKDDVAVEAFKYNLSKMSRLFNSEMEKRSTFRDKLLVYPDMAADFSGGTFQTGGCPVLNTAVESDDTHPVLKQQAAQALIRWKNTIQNLLQSGIEAGEFHTAFQPEKTALTILALLEGAIMIRKVTDNQDSIRLIMDSLREFILRL
jgi:AcrR family transcriptional regulator